MNDPRDRVVNDDDPESPQSIKDVRVELAEKLLDPDWHPVMFIAGDEAAMRGETHWFIGGVLDPVGMAEMMRMLADQVAGHVPARASFNRAARRRAERDQRLG